MEYLSIEVSAPVFNRVVIARVAMDRFESEISISRSILQAETALGWSMEIWFNDRTAAKRIVVISLEQNNCRAEIAGSIG